ncbi:MAG: VanZ family protein [Nitrospirae bacterium]|nr:VanZ family protein [Nitrospirota bacterium]
MFKNKRIFYLSAAIAYALLIFFLSSLTGAEADRLNYFKIWDKLAHFLEYALFCFLVSKALFFTLENNMKRYISLLAVLIVILFAISDEFHQSFVPGRSAEVYDVFADGMGAVLSQIILYIKEVKGDLR